MSHGDQDARFEHWMRDHAAILHKVARAFALGDERRDLLQELMLAVWRAAGAFREESKPSTFLYRVSHNAAMTWKRAQRGRRRRDALAGTPAAHPSPAAGDADALEALYAAIHSLPELDRSLVLLSLDGLSYRDMAEVHGLSEGNVGVRLNRARARLAEMLKEAP
jgi:RNA polymerase sigma factor (sigma-70 family)